MLVLGSVFPMSFRHFPISHHFFQTNSFSESMVAVASPTLLHVIHASWVAVAIVTWLMIGDLVLRVTCEK